MFVQRKSLGVLIAIAGLAWPGCQRAANTFDATVQGAVTIDGELAPRGTVTFHPAKGGSPSSGPIHNDGSYSIRTGQGDLTHPDGGTIRSGKYVVTVTVTAPPTADDAVAKGGPPSVGARLMADKYATKEASDLDIEVKPGPNIIDLKLDGPWANPPQEEADDEADERESADEAASNEPEGVDGEAEGIATDAAEPTDEAEGAAGPEDDASSAEEPATTTDDVAAPADQPGTSEGQP
jgi:hypothetical protein